MCILLCRIKTMKFILLSVFLLPSCCGRFLNNLVYRDHQRKVVVKVHSGLEFQTFCVRLVQWAPCLGFCDGLGNVAGAHHLWPRPISPLAVPWWWWCLPLPPRSKCCGTYSAEPRADAACGRWLEDSHGWRWCNLLTSSSGYCSWNKLHLHVFSAWESSKNIVLPLEGWWEPATGSWTSVRGPASLASLKNGCKPPNGAYSNLVENGSII